MSQKPEITIIGHRGCGSSNAGGTSVYPENSLFSFKKAVDLQIDGVELDVWLSKDNQVIVLHGTNEGKIGTTLLVEESMRDQLIEDLTSEEIRGLHFKEPWILTTAEEPEKIGGCGRLTNYANEKVRFSKLTETEKLEKKKIYGESNDMYLNMRENENIEKILYETDLLHILKEETNEGQESETREEEREADFVESIKCKYCKVVYNAFLKKKEYELTKKKKIFQYLTLFYHVPLLTDILNLFQNKLSYDIELKGSKENLGLYLLDILKNYPNLKMKFSSFHWVLQDDQIKKKVHKNKNLKLIDYESYPFYNVRKIDLLNVLRNNELRIPIALLFDRDAIMPNINSILCSMKYYNADWVHLSYVLNQKPIVLNCNKKNKVISTTEFIDIMHKNKKKIMIYWGTEDKDNKDDLLFYIRAKVNSICPNDITLAKEALLEEYGLVDGQSATSNTEQTKEQRVEASDSLLLQKKKEVLSVC